MLDVSDVCVRLGCNKKAVLRMVESGSLIPEETNPLTFSETEVQRVREEEARQRRLIHLIAEDHAFDAYLKV